MTAMSWFSLSVFCLMITTSPPRGSTINDMVNSTGPHGVSIIKWSGHERASQYHTPGPTTSVTTRACPTNSCVNAVCVIPSCPRRACTGSSDVAVMLEPESMCTSAAAEALGAARLPARCCVRPSTSWSFSMPGSSAVVGGPIRRNTKRSWSCGLG